MMGGYECYSIHGLKSMIEMYENKIADKKKEYDEVEKRYNPLCADGWRQEIKSDIEHIEGDIERLKAELETRDQSNTL